MITFHLSCRQEEKFVQKMAGSGSASTAGGNSQWNSHLWISPPRRASNLPIQYRKTGATARLTATGNRFPAKINRSTAISNRSTVTLNRSTVTLDRSTVTLNRSTVTSNRSTVTSNRSTVTLNRSTVTSNRSTATLNRSTVTSNRSTATSNRFPANGNRYPVAENGFWASRDGSIAALAAGVEISKNKQAGLSADRQAKVLRGGSGFMLNKKRKNILWCIYPIVSCHLRFRIKSKRRD